MKAKKTHLIILSIIIVVTLAVSCVAYAQNIYKTLSAVYMNIKLVIDGIEITPKDVNGNVVEPFIHNGTTYLPVRAIGEAFGKEVSWDGDNATVYVGDVTKPAKEMYLYSRPYIDCDGKDKLNLGESNTFYRNLCTNYVGFRLRGWETNPTDGRHYDVCSITYPTNALAKKVTGTLMPTSAENTCEYHLCIYNESGKLLYQSPLMTGATAPIDFEVDVTNAINLKFEFSGNTSSQYNRFYGIIKDLAIYTTDY